MVMSSGYHRFDRARDRRVPVTGLEREHKEDRRRDGHQQALEDVGIDAGEDPTAHRLRQQRGGADPDAGHESNAKDGVDDDAERKVRDQRSDRATAVYRSRSSATRPRTDSLKGSEAETAWPLPHLTPHTCSPITSPACSPQSAH